MKIGQNYSQELQTFWPDPKIIKLVQQQISQAGLTYRTKTSRYAIFQYELPHQIIKQLNLQRNNRNISFIVLLSKGYPLVSPIIHANSHFCTPSLKDCRNILVELIGQQWHWQITLRYILDKLPKFVKKIMTISDKYEVLQKIGEYHYNKYYEFQIIKQISKNNYFISLQKVEDDINLYVLTLTSAHILLFQPKQQPTFQELKLIIPRQSQFTVMKLVFCAELQALSSIQHNRANKNQYTLSFMSYIIKNMQYSKITYQKTLNITRNNIFMDCLLKNIKDYNTHSINPIEITINLGSILQKDELELISNTMQIQNKIKFYFNIRTIIQLFQAYLRLVQYYSINYPPYQGIYLYKISTLFRRKDVQLVMKSSQQGQMDEDIRLMLNNQASL